ncbi:MAG: gliding motility-associated C-terminal domain-containing protein [Bacteroidetes bacterium]|nr:gliding motility-associated C-terminal domain-containing protein [Bacteroidota bacterium]
MVSVLGECYCVFSQGIWTQKANFGGAPRYAAAGFSIGTKGYIGTGAAHWLGPFYNDFWEWDQATNVWTQKANYGGIAKGAAIGFSIGNKGYIGTGSTQLNPSCACYVDFWEYDPSTNVWTQKANFTGTARSFAIGFSIGTKGYVGTGFDGGNTNDFWEWDQATNTWTQKSNFAGAIRCVAFGYSIGTKGYIGTGWNSGQHYNDFWEWDQATNTWTQKANFTSTLRAECVGFSIGNYLYVGTGTINVGTGPCLTDFWQYDPSTNIWTQMTSFPGGAREVSVGFSIGCYGYIGTGWTNDIPATIKNDFWEFIPPSGGIPVIIINSTNVSICNGQSVTLTASGGTNYSWSNGSTTNPIVITPTTSSTYSVIASNSCGSDTASILITITQQPIATVSGNATICMGQNSTLLASGGTNYSWTTGSTSSAITVSPTTTTSYTVIETNACGTDTAKITVLVNPSPLVFISGNTSICSDDSTTLTVSGGTTYLWSNGSTATSVVLNPSSTSSYSVLVSNTKGCTGTNSVSVTVYPNPATTISGNNTLCIGDNTTLSASGGGIYQWNNGTTGAMITVSPSSTTSYSVTVTSANGCTSSTSDTVSVFPAPTTSISGITNFCQGQMTTLCASGGGNYSWSTGATTSSIVVNNSGTYSVVVSIGSCADSASASIIVNPNPIANAGTNVTITAGSTTTLSASGGTIYSWSNGETTSSIIVSPPITSVYCVTVIDSNGCSDSSCDTVTVKTVDCTEEMYLPNAFSPNEDNENDILLPLGTKCVKTFSLIIYNRWGEKVFETIDVSKSWDGTFNGKKEISAVYTYYIEGAYSSGKVFLKKGNVSLVR